MIDYKYGDLFLENSVSKQLLITDDTGNVTITNKELCSQKFELTESICSEEHLVFGSCEASVLKFTAANIFSSLKGIWLNVQTTLKGNLDEPFIFGRYKVDSDNPTADKKKREYVAYDALYDVINAEMSAWYNTLLPEESSTTILKVFRNSFFSHFGIEQEEVTLINDNMVVTKTIQPEELSGKLVLNAICEVNGCFGHIGRNGKFQYIYLEPISDGLYPSETLYPSENLYPAEPNTYTLHTGTYISASYEDYLVEKITKLQIRQEENDIGAVIGSGDNAYIIQDNFLLYGKSVEDLNTIGQNILGKIGGIYYRPFTAKAKGNPCLEVGDAISLGTKYMMVHSYILQRTLTGIQALRDEYAAEGTQYQPAEVNSVHRSIQQLKGKTNKLTRTIEETRLEMANIEKGLTTTISVTANQIRTEIANTKSGLESSISQTDGRITAEIKRATDAETSLQSAISLTDTNIRLDVSKTYETIVNVDAKVSGAKGYTDGKLKNYPTTAEMTSAIAISAGNITSTVSANYYTKTDTDTKVTSLQSQISQNATSITAEVKRATDAETSLSSSIKITSDKIESKVEKGTISSSISQEAGKIEIKSNRISIESTYFILTDDGKITASEVVLSGKITATSGYIGSSTRGFTILESAIYSGSKKTINTNVSGVYIGADGISCGKTVTYHRYSDGSYSGVTASAFQVDSDGNIYTGGGNLTVGVGEGYYTYIQNGVIYASKSAGKPSNGTYGMLDYKKLHIGTSGDYVQLTANQILFESASTSSLLKIVNASGVAVFLATNSGYSAVSIGVNNGSLGFFGTNPTSKQSVAAISNTSSATVSDVATAYNNLITALKKYGLIA